MNLNAAMSDVNPRDSRRKPRTAVEHAEYICDNLTAKIGRVPDEIRPEVIALLRQKFNTEFPE